MRAGIFGIAILWVGVTASAIGVVFATHKSRVATDELETLRNQASNLHVESGQFLLERSTLAAYSRVEDIAIRQLGMTVPNIDTVVIIKP